MTKQLHPSFSDRDPMLHRPSLWEPLGISPDTDLLVRQWTAEATELLHENAWPCRDLDVIAELASVFGRLQRAGVHVTDSDLMRKMKSTIDSIPDSSRKEATLFFAPSDWIARANQLALKVDADDTWDSEAPTTSLLQQLDDSELAMAILLNPESAEHHSYSLEPCLAWVEDHFSAWCSAMPWIIGMAEAINISKDSENVSLTQSASKFMFWSEQIALAVQTRESVFGKRLPPGWLDPTLQPEAADPTPASRRVIRFPRFESQQSLDIPLALSASTESSEALRKRIETLPKGVANVSRVDVGNAGVMSIEKVGQQYRCHFRAGVVSQPPSVSIRNITEEFQSVSWNAMPNGTSFQTPLFTCVAILISSPEQNVLVELGGDEQS